MGSQLKKAHRTHALAQPAGAPYPHDAIVTGTSHDASSQAERLYAELCRRVPSADDRAALLGVTLEQDTAWRNGQQLRVLRARRKSLAAAVADLPSP